MAGVVGDRIPLSQPVKWEAVPGSVWACLACLRACHSTAPARLATKQEEVPEGNREEPDTGW